MKKGNGLFEGVPKNRRQLCKDVEDNSRLKKCKGTVVRQVPPTL